MGKSKQRIKAPTATGGKRIAAPESSNAKTVSTEHPIFCLHYLRSDYRLDGCDSDARSELLEGFYIRSQLTWGRLAGESRKKLGYEHLPLAQIRDQAPGHFSDEEKVTVFRFGQRARFLGFRTGQTFYVCWLDPLHKLYDG